MSVDQRLGTIAAISTARGVGGVGIVRVSGPGAAGVMGAVFRPARGARRPLLEGMDRRVVYGTIVGREGRGIDECLCLVMLGPKSYTGEDVIEFQCHGGLGTVSGVLGAVLSAGARLAEPGEFTKRAFLNGRVDLSQAEAVGELVRARTERAAALALRQLEGRLGQDVRRIRASLLGVLAEVEGSIDFPNDVGEVPVCRIEAVAGDACRELERLISQASRGRLYRDGALVAILGRPNVGKSSLLNSLLGQDRAIVSDLAGTTRDTIEESISIGGIPARLVDTAGIREVGDAVEAMGVDRAVSLGALADVILLVADGSEALSGEDYAVARATGDRPTILVVNKTDLPGHADVNALASRVQALQGIVEVSARDGTNTEGLMKCLERTLTGSGGLESDEDPLLASVRQQGALESTLQHLTEVMIGLRSGMPQDMVCVDLRSAVLELSGVTGEAVTEDVIDRVFSDFCVGK